MKRIVLSVIACVVFIGLSGCSMFIQPFEEPKFVEIGTSESAFMIPLSGDTTKQKEFNSEELTSAHLIAMKRVRVPREWVQTGRKWLLGIGPYSGYYQPQVRVVKVDRGQCTVEWHGQNNGIWAESKDSVGFSTGISLTARIKDSTDAITFLSNYPPEQKTDETDVEVCCGSLPDVLNEEVRARVQKVFAEQAAAEDMDTLRDKKKEILEAIEKDVVDFFQTRGITITTVGQFGGFTYENPKIQDSIDKVFQEQQDKEVALAETKAAEQRKEALKLKGEGKAAEAVAAAEGEAEAIKKVADARAYEAEQLAEREEFYLRLKDLEVQMEWLDKWDGTLPTYMMNAGGNGTTDLLLQVPTPNKLSRPVKTVPAPAPANK